MELSILGERYRQRRQLHLPFCIEPCVKFLPNTCQKWSSQKSVQVNKRIRCKHSIHVRINSVYQNRNNKATCSPGFKLSTSIRWSYSVKGRCDERKLPHSMLITYMYKDASQISHAKLTAQTLMTEIQLRKRKEDNWMFRWGLNNIKQHLKKLLTISPDLGSKPCHLGIACARSTYAALVPVPKITAAMTSGLSYLPPASVPIVSLTCSSQQVNF